VLPPPPYVTRNVTATPGVSFGQTPVHIEGAVVNGDGMSVPNASLRLVLTVKGFERRISLAGDAAGHFGFTFLPQSSDAGTYEVRVLHPDASTATLPSPQASFTLNRLTVNYSGYNLNAVRGVASPAQLRVTASAGTGATGVQWKMFPADQPSGSLPPGITLDLGTPVDIPAGASAPVNVSLIGSASAGETGTVILRLVAAESGDEHRAQLQLNYRLYEARPGLVVAPTTLELGVAQNHAVSGTITLTNQGYAPAQNVTVALQARDGGAVPAWAHLDSLPTLGALDLGQSAVVQISARPGSEVADGYYQLQLRVTADNDPGRTIPITLAVAQDGQGSISFQLVDIYTQTLDDQGEPIPGLAGARITLQNATLTGNISTATTDDQGVATFSNLPPGNYNWRISAPNHLDTSGRTTVYANLTASERVFLDYQLVSIEFSVTETTIQDVYDIVLEATFQTQVPAPVVLLEPASVNLPEMQQGEEFTGELTLTNYGLVRADHLKFALPTRDDNFQYEFFGEFPTQLEAKARVTIPYRITAIQLLPKGVNVNLQSSQKLAQIPGASRQPSPQMQEVVRGFLRSGDTAGIDLSRTSLDVALKAAKAAGCSSYGSSACATYDYQCAAGDVRGGASCTSFGRMSGGGCGTPYPGLPPGDPQRPPGPDPGGYEIGWGASVPLTPTCTTPCNSEYCQCRPSN
jgi:hypothetical protein